MYERQGTKVIVGIYTNVFIYAQEMLIMMAKFILVEVIYIIRFFNSKWHLLEAMFLFSYVSYFQTEPLYVIITFRGMGLKR